MRGEVTKVGNRRAVKTSKTTSQRVERGGGITDPGLSWQQAAWVRWYQQRGAARMQESAASELQPGLGTCQGAEVMIRRIKEEWI